MVLVLMMVVELLDPDALWIGLVYADTVGTYASSSANPTAIPEQAQRRAFVLDLSDLTAAYSTILN